MVERDEIDNYDGVCEIVRGNENDGENVDESDFFESRVSSLKKVKGEQKTKKRNVLSAVVSGKTVTEDEVLEKVRQHNKKNQGKNVQSDSREVKSSRGKKAGKVSVSKNQVGGKRKGDKTENVRVKGNPQKKAKVGKKASQEAGTSYIYISEDSELETESESEISEEEKCCVCKLFTPTELRKSVSLVFTKWGQCVKCGHWVHLIYCSKVRVLRRGDSFLCMHCESVDKV